MSGEAATRFACFGGAVGVHVSGRSARGDAEQAAQWAEARLLDAHRRLSRFEPESELCRLNRDPRATVPVSTLLLGLAAAARRAGFLSNGLVDATQVEQIARAGYAESRAGGRRESLPPAALAHAEHRPAGPSPEQAWRQISVDRISGTVTRPPGLAIDSGGIAKGMLADLVGAALRDHRTYAIDCCGDVRIGGSAGLPRTVMVEDPLGGEPIHELEIKSGGVATSGITRRSWRNADGTGAHQILDPATGGPAFTGVIQVTALAPTAFLAEVHAKHALLAGSERAARMLPYGGLVVHADSTLEIVPERGATAPR